MGTAEWRAWLDDGKDGVARYSSRDHQWKDLPSPSIIVVMVYFRDGTRRILQNSDFYWLHRGQWGQGMEEPSSPAAVKLGKTVDDTLYKATVDEAMETRAP